MYASSLMRICMTNFSSCAVALVAALTLSTFSSASATVLAEYNFSGSAGNQVSNAATAIADHLQVSAFSRGAGYASLSGTSSTSSNAIAANPGSATSNSAFLTAGYTLSDAIAGDGYFEFSITVEEGYTFSVDSIELGTRRGSNASGPNSFVVRSSLDNYASNLSGPTASASSPTGSAYSGSLTLDFGDQVKDVDGTVTFRIYGYGRNTTNTSYGTFAISNPGATPDLPSGTKNFTINGSVTAIPEPSTLALGALSLVALAYTARRKRA